MRVRRLIRTVDLADDGYDARYVAPHSCRSRAVDEPNQRSVNLSELGKGLFLSAVRSAARQSVKNSGRTTNALVSLVCSSGLWSRATGLPSANKPMVESPPMLRLMSAPRETVGQARVIASDQLPEGRRVDSSGRR